jgi:hypothetical protein
MKAGRPDVHPFLPRYEYSTHSASHFAPDIRGLCSSDSPEYLCYVFDGLYRIGSRWYIKPLSQYAASLVYSGSDVEKLKRHNRWSTFLPINGSFPQEDAIGLYDYPVREHYTGPLGISSRPFVRVIPLSKSTISLRNWHMTNKFVFFLDFANSINLDDLIRCSGFELQQSGELVRVGPQVTCRTLADGQNLPKDPPYSSMWKTIRPYPESFENLTLIDKKGGDF